MSVRLLEKALQADIPLMRCGNRLEFKQRLQWLSEGMLRNHLEGIFPCTPDLLEIERYRLFSEQRSLTDN